MDSKRAKYETLRKAFIAKYGMTPEQAFDTKTALAVYGD